MKIAPFIEIELTRGHTEVAIAALTLSHQLSLGNVPVLADLARAGKIPAGRRFSYGAKREELPLGIWSEKELQQFEDLTRFISKDLLGFKVDNQDVLHVLSMNDPLAHADSHIVNTHEMLRVLRNIVAHHLGTEGFDSHTGTGDRAPSTLAVVHPIGNDSYSVTLRVTGEKAFTLCAALELYTRVGLGQLEYVAEIIREGRIASSLKPLHDEYTLGHRAENMMRGFKPTIGHPQNGGWSIGAGIVAVDTKLAWEIRKEIEKVHSLYRDPNPEFRGVNYDGNIVRYTQEPLPRVRVIETTN